MFWRNTRASSLCWGFFLLTFDFVAGDDGVFSINPIYPSLCESQSVTFSTSQPRPTGAFVIDGSYATLGQEWNLTGGPGISLCNFGAGEQGSISKYITHNADGSYTFKVPPGFLSEPITGDAVRGDCPVNNQTSAAVPSQTGTLPISWPAGACKTSMYTDKTVTCAGKTIPPLAPVRTICSCPGGMFEPLIGGSPCGAYSTSQGDVVVITNACPTSTSATLSSASSMSKTTKMSVASPASKTSTLLGTATLAKSTSLPFAPPTSARSSAMSKASSLVGTAATSTAKGSRYPSQKSNSAGTRSAGTRSDIGTAAASTAKGSRYRSQNSNSAGTRSAGTRSVIGTAATSAANGPPRSSVSSVTSSSVGRPGSAASRSSGSKPAASPPGSFSTTSRRSAHSPTAGRSPTRPGGLPSPASSLSSLSTSTLSTSSSTALSSPSSSSSSLRRPAPSPYQPSARDTTIRSAPSTLLGSATLSSSDSSSSASSRSRSFTVIAETEVLYSTSYYNRFKRAPATVSSIVGPSGTASAAGVQYTLTLTSSIKCNKPVAQNCTKDHTPDFTVAQWTAYSVDDWWSNYVENYKGTNLMTDFWNTYIQEGQNQIRCDVTDVANVCALQDPCQSIKATNPNDLIPAMFVSMAMINFSQLLTQIYAALGSALNDMTRTGGETTQWVNAFEPDPSATSTRWEQILEIVSNLITFIAAFFVGLFPELAPLIGIMIGTSATFAGVGNIGVESAQKAIADFKLNEINTNSQAVINFFQTNEDTVQQTHDAYWNAGKAGNSTVVDLLKGGAYVGSVPNPTDSGDVNLAQYFENFVLTSLTNAWLKQANTFILYIPYGQVFSHPFNWVSFTQADCEKDWFPSGGNDWSSHMIGSCTEGSDPLNPGMVMLVNADTQQQSSWFKRDFAYPWKNIPYDPMDVIKSSMSGWISHGYNYNATQSVVSSLMSDHANENEIKSLVDLTPASAGIYNLAVCKLPDLTAVPWGGYYINKGEIAFYQGVPCDCTGTMANWTNPSTGEVQFFKDFAGTDIVNHLNNGPAIDTQYPDRGPPHRCPLYAGN